MDNIQELYLTFIEDAVKMETKQEYEQPQKEAMYNSYMQDMRSMSEIESENQRDYGHTWGPGVDEDEPAITSEDKIRERLLKEYSWVYNFIKELIQFDISPEEYIYITNPYILTEVEEIPEKIEDMVTLVTTLKSDYLDFLERVAKRKDNEEDIPFL